MRRGVTNKFNRGELDPRAFMREDVEKVNNSCELMENFIPQRLGPMQFRPGLRHIAQLAGHTHLVSFISSTDNDALLAFTKTDLRIWVED